MLLVSEVSIMEARKGNPRNVSGCLEVVQLRKCDGKLRWSEHVQQRTKADSNSDLCWESTKELDNT